MDNESVAARRSENPASRSALPTPRSRAEGIPSGVEGNPSQMEGIPSQTEGIPNPAEGNPNIHSFKNSSLFKLLRYIRRARFAANSFVLLSRSVNRRVPWTSHALRAHFERRPVSTRDFKSLTVTGIPIFSNKLLRLSETRSAAAASQRETN